MKDFAYFSVSCRILSRPVYSFVRWGVPHLRTRSYRTLSRMQCSKKSPGAADGGKPQALYHWSRAGLQHQFYLLHAVRERDILLICFMNDISQAYLSIGDGGVSGGTISGKLTSLISNTSSPIFWSNKNNRRLILHHRRFCCIGHHLLAWTTWLLNPNNLHRSRDGHMA